MLTNERCLVRLERPRNNPFRPARRKPRFTYRSIDDPWMDGFWVHVGVVWTVEEFAEKIKVAVPQVEAWISEGLPVLRVGDGSVRITETAVDEWIRARGGEKPRHALIEQEWLTIQQAAQLTGFSYSHIRRAVQRGDLPAMNLGNRSQRHYRIQRSALNDWMKSRPNPAPVLPRSDIQPLIDRYFAHKKVQDA